MKYTKVSTPGLLMSCEVILTLAAEMILVSTEHDAVVGTTLEPYAGPLRDLAANMLRGADQCQRLGLAILADRIDKKGFHAEVKPYTDVSPN